MMIAMDLLPYTVVDGAGFRNLLELLVPDYQLPHHTTFSRSKVPKLYEETKGYVANIIKDAMATGNSRKCLIFLRSLRLTQILDKFFELWQNTVIPISTFCNAKSN